MVRCGREIRVHARGLPTPLAKQAGFTNQSRSARMNLTPTHNIWRRAQANRAAILVDGADYFGAARNAMVKAKHTILIAGWDLHSQTRLIGADSPKDGYPLPFAEFLAALVNEKPELDVYLLLWDFSMLYAAERDLFPTLTLRWNTPSRIRFCLDDCVPLGSSQHQKLVVVDDAVAFSGGLDLTIRRWDTAAHRYDEPGRVDPNGKSYLPFHDVQMIVDGEAACALGDLVRMRWSCAACEDLLRVDVADDPWPGSVPPDFTNVTIGIARTEPPYANREPVHEVEQLFIDCIDAAERSIYIENQFMTAPRIAERLAARLRACPDLEVLIVCAERHDSWLEAHIMRAGRTAFGKILHEAGSGRVLLMYPQVESEGCTKNTMVHSKVFIVDDCILRIGSANLNNRSMGTDSECDLVIVARDDETRRAITRQRNRLLGDHCGVSADTVAVAIARAGGSLIAVAQSLHANGHRLVPICDESSGSNEVIALVQNVVDPEQPIGAEEFVSQMFGGYVPTRNISTVLKVIGAGLFVVALALFWEFAPLIGPETVQSAFASIADNRLAPFIVVAIFVAAGFALFPVTVLIAATAAAFGPWFGFAYAAAGALASALASYMIGAAIGRRTLRDFLGPSLNRIRQRVAKRGVIAIAAIRLIPVAPFTVVNLVAGASSIPLFDYLVGTVMGMLPGLVMISAVGHQFARILNAPTVGDLIVLVVAVTAWIAVSIGIQAIVSRYWSPG
jgi:phospholipase D1/2